MKNIKYLLFDCMETLIDMTEAPNLKEDALWAFEGSDNELYWDNFEEFFEHYKNAKFVLEEKFPDNKEYNMLERYKFAAKNKISEENELFEEIVRKFSDKFWGMYKSRCYIKDDVKSVLLSLSDKYQMGVVSNFKISGGVEELLEMVGISDFFQFKVVSVNVGWRKPNCNIYNIAKEMTGLGAEEIVFIGDDYECDYIGPKKVGMNSILLDRHSRYLHVKERINDFYGLKKVLENE